MDAEGLEVTPPATTAAGTEAVAESLRQARRHLGGKRAGRLALKVNQPGGFDCPGCAWPEAAPGERRHLEFCENGIKALAEEATTRTIGADFFARHSIPELVERDGHWLGQQGRLAEPLLKRPGDRHYRPIDWSDALDLTAGRLAALDSPDRAVFYTSGRASNEAAWSWALFARLFGTNNLPDCSNLCHESSGRALTASIGVGKGTVSLADFDHAELILVIGQNPGTNHPRMLTTLGEARRRGARIISINPLPEAGLLGVADPQKVGSWFGRSQAISDDLLQIRLGGDLALLQMVGRLMLDAERRRGGIVDRAFVDEHTLGFDEWAAHIAGVGWDETLVATGLQRAEIEDLARAICSTDRIIVCWAMGLTQHRRAVDTIREVANLLLARGAIGRPGAGLCPVRGHSNVQGDRTMGVWERPSEAFLARFDAALGTDLPRAHGLDVVDTIQAMEAGEVDVFCALGGNFAKATPDGRRTAAALEGCGLTVQLSTKLNHSHLTPGETALILPVLGRTEIDRQKSGAQFVTVEDSMSAVHASRGTFEPASPQLRSETAVVCDLAERVVGSEVVDWSEMAADYRVIRRHIAATIAGFEDFEARVDRPEGFVIAQSVRDARRFSTPDRRAHFSVASLGHPVAPEGALLLQTLRSHDQFNTTIYGLDDRYRGVTGGRRVVFVSSEDLAALGFDDGDTVDLETVWDDGVERRAEGFRVVEYPTPAGCAAAYFPETNDLVPLDSVALGSNTPVFKAIPVRLARPATASAGLSPT